MYGISSSSTNSLVNLVNNLAMSVVKFTLLLYHHACHSYCRVRCHLHRTQPTALEAHFAELRSSIYFLSMSLEVQIYGKHC